MVKGLCGSSTDSHPIIFRWLSLKGGNLNLVELFDQVGHLHWRWSLVSVLFVTLYYLSFLLLQEILLICIVVTKVA